MPLMFLGHGNPMNALDDNRFTQSWARLGQMAGKPRAILMISAHWQTRGIAVTALEQPPTIHDFGAFPQALFDVRYPAPGSMQLAQRVQQLLAPQEVTLDKSWGFDHGTWSTLVHAYPQADVPVVQLSMNRVADHRFHFEIGQKLQALRDEGVLIIGSGNVVHNLGRMSWQDQNAEFDWARSFQDLVCRQIELDQPEPLFDYAALGTAANLSVPSADHYLPLLYVLGARHAEDSLSFETPEIQHGSLSMMSVVFR
jgi:4,5-DOPA dioxygenase extradiol